MSPTDTDLRPPSAGTVSGTARLMFYALLAVSLMTLDHRGHHVDRLRSLALQAVEPVFGLVDLPFMLGRDLSDYLGNQRMVVDQRDALVASLLEMRARLSRLELLEQENDQLRTLLDSATEADTEYLAAELAAVDLDPFAHRILVRRGQADGVIAGMPVIDDRGVIGQVDKVMNHMSSVVLITDPDHALPVQIQPDGERTIAYGSGAFDTLRLNDLPMNTRATAGSLVITSGLGGRFPRGLPVARIESVQRDPGRAFAQAEARPLAAMDRNRFVLLLTPEPLVELPNGSREDEGEVDSATGGIEADAAAPAEGGDVEE